MSTYYRHLLLHSVQLLLIVILIMQSNERDWSVFDSSAVEQAEVVNNRIPATANDNFSLLHQPSEIPINSDPSTPVSMMEVLDSEEQFSAEDEFITESNSFHLICYQSIHWLENSSRLIDGLLLTTTQPPDRT